MKIIHNVADLPRNLTGSVGFVPTMGAFHEGHLALMRRAKAENDHCVVSLFVNPKQFGANEDFGRYPRDLTADAAMAEAAGADFLFAPTREDVYPTDLVDVVVRGVTDRWEGAHRPGHFAGVATVVLKLFNLVRPDLAYFGQKDLQQCQVIRQMVDGLNVPVRLVIHPTIRDADGLAMSSRNRYLSEEHRAKAPLLYASLTEAANAIRSGSSVASEEESGRSKLEQAGFLVEYFAAVSLPGMDPLIDLPGKESTSAIIVAAKIGTTRLIDNVSL